MNRYPRLILALAVALCLMGAYSFAQTIFSSFTAEAYGEEYVVLEWKSDVETGLVLFQPERSYDGLVFQPLADVSPTGNYSTYRFEDHDVAKSGNRTYYYRVRALLNDGTSVFSDIQSVTLFYSGIQQTWGSIKALFR